MTPSQSDRRGELARQLLAEYWKNYGQKGLPTEEWYDGIPPDEKENWCKIADFILAREDAIHLSWQLKEIERLKEYKERESAMLAEIRKPLEACYRQKMPDGFAFEAYKAMDAALAIISRMEGVDAKS